METMLLRIFQRQIRLQCKFLLVAAHDLNCAVKNADVEHTFYALQNLLNSAANISKGLWGQHRKVEIALARKPLRDSIGIDDSSPLRDTNMRNHFEHFDERLDRWYSTSQNHNHMDLFVGPKNMITGNTTDDKFRHFDPTTTDMLFWGQTFNIQKIVNEAQRILPKLEEESGKPHW